VRIHSRGENTQLAKKLRMSEEEEALVLNWQEFSRNIISTSAVFRRESTFADLTLVVEGAQVQVHRFILASCSPLFLGMLRHLNHPHPFVFLRGVDHHHLLLILDFMYLGEVSVLQKDLPAFLRTAEDLQVKGLIEKVDLVQEEGINETHEVVSMDNTGESESCPSPMQNTSKVDGQTVDGVHYGDDQCESFRAGKKVKTESKPSIKRTATNKTLSNAKQKRKKTSNMDHLLHRNRNGVEIIGAGFPETAQEQMNVLGNIKAAKYATEKEVGQHEESFSEKERSGSVEENQEEPSLLDATDSTITEVENMLKETRRLLGEETGLGVANSTELSDQQNLTEGILPNPLTTQKVLKSPLQSLPNVPQVKKTRNTSNTVAKKPQTRETLGLKNSSTDLKRPGTPLGQVVPGGGDPTLNTPSKVLDPSEKEKAIIACLITKMSSTHGWRCTVCRSVFPTKTETEEHVGVSHVMGNLT